MVHLGKLIKLNRGLYHIVPLNANALNFIPDWHLVAKYLMKGKKYYIGYYSAMQIHGLITQPSNTEIIVSPIQATKSKKYIQNTEFQFVTVKRQNMFGIENKFINDHDKVKVSDLEKTLVDILTKPHLSGGMIEIGKAIFETKDKINLSILLDYLTRNDSNAAIKRYLFLCDLLSIEWTTYHESMWTKETSNDIQNGFIYDSNKYMTQRNHKLGSSYPLLDTSAPNEGTKDSKFGLKINVDTETIKNSIYT